MSESNEVYQTNSAILFIIFNRPDTTAKVFEQIKAARPPRLYIAADGPRAGRKDEELLCAHTRKIIAEISWDCQVKTLFRDHNVGCKEAVSEAVTWFFSNEEEGIILEDDCLPNQSFFTFCDTLLEKYRADYRIRHISGGNFQHGQKWGNASYYFSSLTHVWGWASWRRVWDDYDKELTRYTENDAITVLTKLFGKREIITKWHNIFKAVKEGRIDTWDYQLAFTNFFQQGLCIVPNFNMISNIGFGDNATHTVATQDAWANIPLVDIGKIYHPEDFVIQIAADISTLMDKADHSPGPGFFTKTFNRWRRSINKRIKR
jgi:hypothetical protein